MRCDLTRQDQPILKHPANLRQNLSDNHHHKPMSSGVRLFCMKGVLQDEDQAVATAP